MATTRHRARTGHRARWFGAAAGLAMIASLGVGVQSASAATHSATRAGEHSVCAQTLNQWVWDTTRDQYNVVTVTSGSGYYVTGFAQPNWVYGYARVNHTWGYVHNGWFC